MHSSFPATVAAHPSYSNVTAAYAAPMLPTLTSAQQLLRRQDAEAGLVWADPLDDSERREIADSDGDEDDSYESYGMIGELTRRINAITVSSRSSLPAKPVAVQPTVAAKPVPAKPATVEKTQKHLGRPRHDARGRGLWRYVQQEEQEARERQRHGLEPQPSRLYPYQQQELARARDRKRQRASSGHHLQHASVSETEKATKKDRKPKGKKEVLKTRKAPAVYTVNL
ncbi:hypothetical protein DFH07DRAFT_32768 [Mycena maculata]|uniref:Uncharacterized protein n=1 Tax=Mycena maculata TaxID=230809 RepID=A0AAD7K2L1_9AGAR|nr:hypothetical protein DFH07DRAFT_32768 [Mycena maculata]